VRPIPDGYEESVGVVVTDEMTVDFQELGRVHPVYATYWLAKHMEEAGRKIILPFLEEGEEGLGTAVHVEHRSSALVGMRLEIVARYRGTSDARVQSTCEAHSELGDLIGTGSTEQFVTGAAKVADGFAELERRWAAFREAKRTGRPPG
jgi:fluoroacetyl-CoA thioesterase